MLGRSDLMKIRIAADAGDDFRFVEDEYTAEDFMLSSLLKTAAEEHGISSDFEFAGR